MRRLLVFLVLLPGGLLLLAVALAARAREQLARLKVRADLRVLVWSRVWTFVYRVPWSLHLAVLAGEGASVAREGRYPIGDKEAARGPAFGPGQVLRSRYERLLEHGRRRTFAHGDWDDSRKDSYTRFSWWVLALVRAPAVELYELEQYARGSVWASVVILREALDEVGGDKRQAARRYNGFGAPAEAYADKVMQRLESLA